jgi:hypothetical protein
MEASSSFEEYVPGGLASLGLEVDEVDLAVLRVAHGIWWPTIRALLDTDLSAVELETDLDLSRGPQP